MEPNCGETPITSLEREFARLEVGGAIHFHNLTLFPLLGPEPAPPELEYLLLGEAITQRFARVTELHGGTVPELRFENCAPRPVLLLDGEELIGAKQNRVLNLTILAPANKTITIPVSCVEAGRWHMATAEFRPAEHVMYSRGRARRAEQVTESMRTEGSRRSDQSAVWSDIAAKASRLGTSSSTQAMSAMYERHAISVAEYVRAFSWQERQVGVLFAIGGKPLGLDLFDHPESLRRLFEKLVRSYALDAIDAPLQKTDPAGRLAVSELLSRAAASESFEQPAIGLGEDIRLAGNGVSGAALWFRDRYVHLCAFTRDEDAGHGDQISTRMSRPTHRRL